MSLVRFICSHVPVSEIRLAQSNRLPSMEFSWRRVIQVGMLRRYPGGLLRPSYGVVQPCWFCPKHCYHADVRVSFIHFRIGSDRPAL